LLISCNEHVDEVTFFEGTARQAFKFPITISSATCGRSPARDARSLRDANVSLSRASFQQCVQRGALERSDGGGPLALARVARAKASEGKIHDVLERGWFSVRSALLAIPHQVL